MNSNWDVCIVGAGPGGALLGYLLAKQNISTIVLERHGEMSKEFRGEHLNAEGEQVLRTHSLFDKVEEAGILLMQRIEYWDNGKVIKTIAPDASSNHVGIHVPQQHLLHVLAEESEQLEHYQLMLETRATALLQDASGRCIGVKAKQKGKDIIIHSSVVVGADGRYSTVRKLSGIRTDIIKHGYDLLWAKIPSPAGWEPTVRLTMAGHQQLALFTQAGGFIQIGWNIEEGSYPALRKQSFTPFVQQLIDAFPELTSTVHQHIQSWNDFVLLEVQSCRCDTWVQDGLVLMGDAAHTMSPAGAFGLNCSLKDAEILAGVLQEALRQNNTSVEQLQNFEHARRKAVEAQQAQQRVKEASFVRNFAFS